MDEKEKHVAINTNGEDNRAIGYNYNQLDDLTSDSDANFEDYLTKT